MLIERFRALPAPRGCEAGPSGRANPMSGPGGGDRLAAAIRYHRGEMVDVSLGSARLSGLC
jgi:hypothetical protein